MDKLVSIIIPVYNAEKYLVETIESVISQTYKNWELIIINDGSTDNSESIAKSFLYDKRIQYIYQNNAGVSIARNQGIELIKGDYITFLDADDVWEKENIVKKLNLLNTNSDIYWVFSDMYLADENMNVINIAPLGVDINILENILLWYGEVIPGPCSNIMVKKECIDAGIKFNPELSTGADQDFCIQLASNYKGKKIQEPLFSYRIHASSLSRKIKVMERDHVLIYRIAARNKHFKSFWFKQKCFSNLYLILAGSWWVNANNRLRGIYFLIKTIISYPPNIIKVVNKSITYINRAIW